MSVRHATDQSLAAWATAAKPHHFCIGRGLVNAGYCLGGTLDATQMAGAFQMLNSNDRIWSRLIHDYLMGERTPMIDQLAWNADTTRMPYRMHSDYLRKLFLGNDLASGRYVVDGHAIAIQNIRAPIFAISTERDHAPWHSVYTFQLGTNFPAAMGSGTAAPLADAPGTDVLQP